MSPHGRRRGRRFATPSRLADEHGLREIGARGRPRSPWSLAPDERIPEPAQLVTDVSDASIPVPALYLGGDVTLPPVTLTAVESSLNPSLGGAGRLEPAVKIGGGPGT